MGVMFTNLANYGAPPCRIANKKAVFLFRNEAFTMTARGWHLGESASVSQKSELREK